MTYASLPSALDDGDQFHTLRFDWHTTDPRVEFLRRRRAGGDESRPRPKHSLAALDRGLVPEGLGGHASVRHLRMVIDWVRITPFQEDGDEWTPESFPNDGWSPRYPKGVPGRTNADARACAARAPADDDDADDHDPQADASTDIGSCVPHVPRLRRRRRPVPPSTWCRASGVCQGYPDYASFDPSGLCCGTTATPRPTPPRHDAAHGRHWRVPRVPRLRGQRRLPRDVATAEDGVCHASPTTLLRPARRAAAPGRDLHWALSFFLPPHYNKNIKRFFEQASDPRRRVRPAQSVPSNLRTSTDATVPGSRQ